MLYLKQLRPIRFEGLRNYVEASVTLEFRCQEAYFKNHIAELQGPITSFLPK